MNVEGTNAVICAETVPEQAHPGTLGFLIDHYRSDPESAYQQLRYHVRRNQDDGFRRLKRQLGSLRLVDIDTREFKAWHRGWSEGGKISSAHLLIGQLRALFTHGALMTKGPDRMECIRIREVLRLLRFPVGKPRESRMTSLQADAIRAEAHRTGWNSIALAQAFQFDLMLRQKDVLGEWVPLDEPGESYVTGPKGKWLRGIRWEEIDDNLILRHTTSKKEKPIVVDLKLAPMVMAELERMGERPMTGPVILCELGRLPYVAADYRRRWRDMANSVGVPKTVWNMDTRSGAISEATDAGAELELVRHAAAHSQVSMTARYSRGSEEKIAKVMQLRVKHRGGTDDGRE